MPALEMAQDSGKILRWLKTEGARVRQGEPIMEIETDKVTVEIEAPASGILANVTAREGDVVPVGQTIAQILAPEEAPSPSSRRRSRARSHKNTRLIWRASNRPADVSKKRMCWRTYRRPVTNDRRPFHRDLLPHHPKRADWRTNAALTLPRCAAAVLLAPSSLPTFLPHQSPNLPIFQRSGA
jgi:pyruvate/2-oxoglutarate dehydrogenase complex dihydrolipoamide acyltransferase (E2) component